jgi:hypothetical protein
MLKPLRHCACCGTEMESVSSTKAYCSDACRKKAEVTGSTPVGCASSINGLASRANSDQDSLSAECPRNVFPARSGQDDLLAQEVKEASSSVPSRQPTASQKVVRGRSSASARHRTPADRPSGPAHPSNLLIAQLNESWRVVDDPLQWILQRRKGNPRSKAAGWRGRSYCGMREALVRCVREYCGEVDVDALAKLNKLPVWHLDWDRTNLDVPETDHAQSDRQSEPLAAKALEVPDADE